MKQWKKWTYMLLMLLVLSCGSTAILSCVITPITAEAATITINKKKLTLNKGKTYQLKVTGTKGKVIWKSNKPSVAEVNSKGKVTAKKTGQSTITAKVGNTKYTCKVTVVSKCKHSKTVVKNKQQATCLLEGYTGDVYCSRCGKMISKGKSTPALGHVYTDYKSNNDATCTQDGTKTALCDRCKEKNTVVDVGSKLNHDMTVTVSERKEPTCTENGMTEKIKCSRCEYTTGGETITALGHTYTDYKSNNDATCTQDGTKTALCDRCKEKNTVVDVGSKLNHDMTVLVSEGKEPTCTENGMTEKIKCSRCEYTTGGETVTALGHTKDNVIKCKRCGQYLISLQEIGKTYKDANGLDITVNSYNVSETDGYYEYDINYTVSNNVPDSILMPGSFKLFYVDHTGEPQYGFFDYLYYGDTETRSYSWKVLKSQEVLILEYNASDLDAGLEGSFFRNDPIANTYHWVPSNHIG